MSQTTSAPAEFAVPKADWSGKAVAVIAIFILSGASGLIYEVIWMRMLTYIIGASLYAVTAVIAAFMGGLALGSFLIGKRVDHISNPLRLYAGLELVVAIAALALPFLFKMVDPIYGNFYDASPMVRDVLRFVLCFGLLLIPTTCLGATLPVLSRWAAQSQENIGISLGRLYAANTAGAVIGVFSAGFILIGNLGVNNTLYLAAGINVLVAIIAFALSAKDSLPVAEADVSLAEPIKQPEIVLEKITPGLQKLVFWAYGLSGLIALAYQVVWFRSLVFSFAELKSTTYAFSAMLTVFLIGLALGGAVGSKIVDTLTHPVRCFGIVQFAIGISGFLSFFMIYNWAPNAMWFLGVSSGGTFSGSILNMLVQTAGAIFLPTFLMGMLYPIVIKIDVSAEHAGLGVSRLYAINTLGSILGALIGSFILIRFFGIAWTIVLLAVVNVLLALAVLLNLSEYKSEHKMVLVVMAVLMFGVIWWRISSENRVLHDPKEIVQVPSADGLRYAYDEGPLATVAVTWNSIGDRTIMIDNVGVAGTDDILLTDQKSLAHVPMLFLPNPKSALTVGFGSGGASWSYLQYPELEEVHCVEICKEVPLMAEFLEKSNHGLMRDSLEMKELRKRFIIIFDDARSYLRHIDRQYDIIATDCTDLRYKTNANLYDLEYFKLCKERLTDEGMVVVWMPLAGLSEEAFLVALRTFAHEEAFPNMQVYYMNNVSTHYILLLGSKKEIKIDWNRMVERLKIESVRKDLAELNLHIPEKVLSCFVTDAKSMKEKLNESDVLNTENWPYLEFKSPLYGYGDKPLLDNLDLLIKYQADVMDYLDKASLPADFTKRFEPWISTVPQIVKGHAHYRKNEIIEACSEYLAVLKKNPDDLAVKQSAQFETLQRKIDAQKKNIWALVMMGEVLVHKGRYEEAYSYFYDALGEVQVQAQRQQNNLNFLKLAAQAHVGVARCTLANDPSADVSRFLDPARKMGEEIEDLKVILEWVKDVEKMKKKPQEKKG